jgi:antitoxin ParD1/3/4
VRDLIRRDQEREHKLAALRRFVDEGEASGISDRSIDDILAAARKIAAERGYPE